MDLQEIKRQLLIDDAFVLEEVRRLQFLYRLKDEIRYNDVRQEEFKTESVAEHVFGMHVLATYFIELEDTERQWDRERIHNMILWHDMDEIISGDIMGYLKTETDRKREREAAAELIAGLSPIIRSKAQDYISEYERRESIEAKFVKAIDKLEPSLHSFNEEGKKVILRNQTTVAQHRSIKDHYMVGFPFLTRFNELLTTTMEQQGFFVE